MGGERVRATSQGRAGPGPAGAERRAAWCRSGLPVIAFVALVAGMLVAGCGDKGSKVVSTTPTRTDVIGAVQKNVSGKTYTATVYKTVPTTRFCTEIDVDLDPYMPHNPELAKCPYAGKAYVVQDSVASQETRKCAALPGASDSGWYVEDRGDGRWMVSRNASSWDVEKVSGGSVSLPSVNVSGFTFTIDADQDC